MDTRTAATHSLIGQSKSALDTPALLVDLDIMEANIARIVATCRAHGVAWRPHTKAHKTPEIAHMQIAAGAIGITCAKLGEAEVMAAAGTRDILLANQIVGPIKIGRLVAASASAGREAGYRVEVVSCGGTGTFPYCAQQPGVTEVQVGGAIFSDMHYLTHYHVDFALALTVLTTVTSRPTPTRIVVDAGKKTMSGDAAMPAPSGLPPIAALKLSAEHAKIELEQPSGTPKIGDKIEFVVGYSDTTVHLHEEIVGVRDGRIASIWRVAGRGKIK